MTVNIYSNFFSFLYFEEKAQKLKVNGTSLRIIKIQILWTFNYLGKIIFRIILTEIKMCWRNITDEQIYKLSFYYRCLFDREEAWLISLDYENSENDNRIIFHISKNHSWHSWSYTYSIRGEVGIKVYFCVSMQNY